MTKDLLEKELQSVVQSIAGEDMGTIALSRPEYTSHGDFATSIALALAKKTERKPQDLAKDIVAELEKSSSFTALISKTEIAGPGFINFFLSDEVLKDGLEKLSVELEDGFSFSKDERVNLEFLSANPTGKLHIGHARGAFYGDVLANILSYAGADVVREFYINNSRESNQIHELGKTALGQGEQYKTPWLEELIAEVEVSDLDEEKAGMAVSERVQKYNEDFIQNMLGIKYDVWYSEETELRASGNTKKALEKLREKGYVYEDDGAEWLKTSEFGDEKDRVVVRSDGSMSYFVADIAYHEDKFARGFNPVINVWGADHQGHVKRMQAVAQMLGWGRMDILVTQLVTLKKDGALEKMSKRAGNVVLFEDLVSEFGIDVVRWFFLERSLNHHIAFDEELAKEQSDKNPVFYVQYAHARMYSILEKIKDMKEGKEESENLFETPSARALATHILEFPEVVKAISCDSQVHGLTTYATDLAQAFSRFYHDVRIIEGKTYNPKAAELLTSTHQTLSKTLSLLGINAPEKM